MSRIDFEPWEPEESVGKLWHSWASRFDAPSWYDEAGVGFEQVRGRLSVLFRGLGGDPAIELKPVAAEGTDHRLSLRRRLGTERETAPQASFDGAALRLPDRLALFPDPAVNGAVYLWLTAQAACAPALAEEFAWLGAEEDPLRRDVGRVQRALRLRALAVEAAPGLEALAGELDRVALALRPDLRLPPEEDALEDLIRHGLAGLPLPELADLRAPRGYRSFRPVPIWLDLRALEGHSAEMAETRATEGDAEVAGDDRKSRRARRKKADQAERRDSLILHKFEAILSWAEFLNLNRRIEDDDDDSARKAADDVDEIALGQISKAPATRLRLHLDLAPEDVDLERASGRFTYPEWDVARGRYLPEHAVVLASRMQNPAEQRLVSDDPASARRIRAVRAQFEAMRPGRVMLSGQIDGEELDLDAATRSHADLRASGQGNDRIWRQSRPQARDLAVSILLDVSRSTESAVSGRAVIEIEREALAALAWGLDACGDDFAIHAFSSLKRHRVFVQEAKRFAEPMSAEVESRIAALMPGHYTRLGAAIRHVSAGLSSQARKRRLLLVITDGKPNDLDHYEGRHGIEDSRMAVREARRAGHAVFGITVDHEGKAWFPRIFGRGGHALIGHADHLTGALPQIYRQLVGA